MEKQTVIFTALPNGRAADGSLRLSVFVAPRLWSDDVSVGQLALDKFPDWLDWPARVAAASWSVAIDGGAPLAATVESAPPRTDLWQALFKTDTDVVPFRFEDFRGVPIETFQTGALVDVLAGLYGRAASDPAYGAGRDLPAIETLAADPDLGAIARPSLPEVGVTYTSDVPPLQLGGEIPPPTPEKPKPGPGTPPPTAPAGGAPGCGCGCLVWPVAVLFWLFPGIKKLFGGDSAPVTTDDPPSDDSSDTSTALPTASFPLPGKPAPAINSATQAPPAPPPPRAPLTTPAALAKKAIFDAAVGFVSVSGEPVKLPTAVELEDLYDFHRMIAALGDFPVLLRQLGLVVDLQVSLGGVALPATGTVQVSAGFAPFPAVIEAAPRTHFILEAGAFFAQPRPVDPEISRGLLRLQDESLFRVVQVDAVGAALKVQNAATNFLAFAHPKNRAPSMPDEGGLPALRTTGLSVIRQNTAGELRAAFLRSAALHLRIALLDLAPQPPPPPAAGPDPAATDELYAEDLVRGYRVDVFDTKLAGWRSLCRRVGTYEFLDAPVAPMVEEDEGFVQFSATQPVQDGAQPTKLRTSDALFVWDGWSLCAPRPGRTILTDQPAPAPSELDYLKNEAATKFRLNTNFTAQARSLPRLRFGSKYHLRARVCDLAGNSIAAPDAAPEQTAENMFSRYEPVSPPALMMRHGPVEAESVERLVVRTPVAGGRGATTERHLIPPKAAQLLAEQSGKFDGVPAMRGDQAGYDLAARERGSVEQGAITDPAHPEVWVRDVDSFVVHYLPDPAAQGVLLMGLPGLGENDVTPLNRISYAGAWPDLPSLRLRLVRIPAGQAPAVPTLAGGVVEVQLAAAEKAVVRVSSFFGPGDLERQAVWQWTKQSGPVNLPTLEQDALDGRSWAHLPWRELTLVHAVLQPIAAPKLTLAPTVKVLHETAALITGSLEPHVSSTGKVDVLAAWSDPVDDPALPAPTTAQHSTHLCEVLVPEKVKLPLPLLEAATQKPVSHAFNDTKYHSVTYTPVATTRYREYFPAAASADPKDVTLTGSPAPAIDVLNSARPDLPKVLYVVPTFEWLPGVNTSTRLGGGLRIYLDRPWHSSGAGELLGVVYWPGQPFASMEEPQQKLFTRWGADPLWLSAPPDAAAQPGHFVGAAVGDGGLLLEESAVPASVAAYLPEFDAERRLWFVDVQLQIGASYTPFVRLALARYQPRSVPGAHLSRVVQADFAQLAPDRTATIVSGAGKVKITVTGPTYTQSGATRANTSFRDLIDPGSGRIGLAEIEVELQKREPGVSTNDPDLGWATVSTTLLQQTAATPGQWSGEVPLPAGVPGSDPYRLLIKEYEWHRTDFLAEPVSRSSILKGQPTFDRRIVYAAQFPLV